MFTGIVEELGSIESLDRQGDSAVLRIAADRVLQDVAHGASIAVNGVCLTVVDFDETQFSVDVMAETLRLSSLGAVTSGSPVNLERAMRADGRWGGHVVQGHVDGTAVVVGRTERRHWTEVRLALPGDLAPYVAQKGSVALDGVSLTVAAVTDDSFTVCLIPTTLASTTLGRVRTADAVNVEVDVLAKYLERLAVTGRVPQEAVR